jgi:NAD(P)-dependent dehydrogenase (short-subunit alcohol dehydrogenase family)
LHAEIGAGSRKLQRGMKPEDNQNIKMTTVPELFGTTYPCFRERVYILTGIGQSITTSSELWGNGAATARLLCANGAKVFGCDINEAAAEKTKSRLDEEFGPGCCAIVKADVTVRQDIEQLVASCLETFGRIDGLVNNVGLSQKGGPAELSEDVWDAQIDVNLKSVYLTCHEVLPIFEKQGFGVITNLSSVAGLRYIGKPQVAYAAAKAAIIQFTKTTAVLYAAKGVRLNTVVPGLMHTPLVEGLAAKYAGGDYEGFVKTRNEQVPSGKMGNAFDVANAILFLMSDNAKYITGQEIIVDAAFVNSTGRI